MTVDDANGYFDLIASLGGRVFSYKIWYQHLCFPLEELIMLNNVCYILPYLL